MRPLLMTLGDYRNLSLNGAKRLSYLTQLFPSSFNEKLCEQLLQHLKKLLEVAILAHKGNWWDMCCAAAVVTPLSLSHGPVHEPHLCGCCLCLLK